MSSLGQRALQAAGIPTSTQSTSAPKSSSSSGGSKNSTIGQRALQNAGISTGRESSQSYVPQNNNASLNRQQFYYEFKNYSSGKTDYATTQNYYTRAVNNASIAKSADEKRYWLDMADYVKGQVAVDNRGFYSAIGNELEELKASKETNQNNLKGYQQAVYTGSQTADILAKYDQALKENANYDKRIKELEAQRVQLDDELFDGFASQEVKDARKRLESGESSKLAKANIRPIGPDGKPIQLPTEVQGFVNQANQQAISDQEIVDNFMRSVGSNVRYYNAVDRGVAAAESAGQEIVSSGISFASTVGKALDSYEGSDINVETRGASVNGNYKTKAEREADKQRVGLPENQATEDYLAWYNAESAKFNDANFASGNSRDAFEEENRQRLEALIKPEIEAYDKRISYLETRIANQQKSGTFMDSEALRIAQEDSAKLKELKKQREDMENRLLDAQGLRDKTSFRYKLATDYQNDVFAKMDSVVDTLDAKSQAEILKAKEGASKLGGVLLDMEKTGIEMGFDMVAGMATGGSSLVPMFVRVMGNEAAAARRDGATLDQQLKYAVTKAGIEVATEKLFGAFDKIGYGKGIANEMSERIVAKLAETDIGRTVVRALIAAAEEGAEEGLADILAPIADQMYKDETWKESWDNNTANFWYDVLLGAAMGGLGFAGGVVSGQNTQANQELRRNEASQSIQNMADYETALEQYNDKVDSRTRELVKYEGMTEAAAKAQAVEEIGEAPQEPTLSAGATAQQKLTALKMIEQLAGENANLEEVDNDIKLTQEEFDSAVQQGLVEKADAAKYLATEEAGEVEEAPAATGDGVQSRLSAKDNKTRKVDENGNPLNRMRKLTERMARIAERLGYGNKTNQSDAYKTATGMTPEEVDSQNNAASAEAMQEAGAQPKGGDASPYNLDNYDQSGINKLWKDRKMTSGQYAEAMVQKGFWSEATARNFLSLVRREGDRLGLNTTEERKRNLGNYTIGQNNAQNVPQEQAVSEGTPAPAETEKTVKPQAESAEQSQGDESTAVNTDEAEHTPEENKIIDEYQNSVDDKLKSVIESHLNNSAAFTRQNINSVSEKQASDLNNLLGGDYSGYSNAINSNGIKHIIRRHGKNGTQDNSMADVNDIARIGYVLDNYDSVELSTHEKSGEQVFSKEFRDADDNPAPVVRFSKKVNGTYYVVEAVADNQYKKLWVVSAYMAAKKGEGLTQASDADGNATTPDSTPEASLASQPSPNNIAQENDNSKFTSVAEAPGTIKESDSEALRKQTARGEEKAVRDSGGTTFVSKTNADRSFVADKAIGENDENLSAVIDSLLNKDERWDDQDVVTAERAMYKMIRAIRDYQLGNSRKMKKSGFDALIKRYNDLTTRHINEKSKAGQELQATYQFTPEELVMNRMAKTFLGFAKDGTFAGNTNLAVNAKIYAAAEDAANRITKAAEAKDAKALAQICKDISDIRGVKNMFGAASGFASKVENEILNAIAQQENGVEALQTLALGNLNAICDDVQPYKVVNAAKTIRVMNMLSNMSTIINNITNNIASGLTSTNAVSQGASLLASKAFENITGQTVLTPAAKGWVANKEIRNAEMEALKMATLVQLYGVNQENGKLEIQGDKGLFNPNANAFEQTMAMYKFFIGMGVEATDQVKSEGLMKAMNIGIDKALAKGKITEKQAEAMRQEAKHEVNRLLYKDDNRLSGFVQGVRNKLNKAVSWGNDDIGTIGLGDIAMAFAKVPANVVRARLYATPEGCLVQLAQYTKGVMKAKRMHSETMARQIMEDHAPELKRLRAELQDAYDLEAKEVSRETKDAKIAEIKNKIAALNRECWNEAREKCSGGVYNKLVKMRDNYGSNLDFDDCVQRCKYSDATEMSQFEAATYSRKIGKAATSAGMVALGAILRGLGALRDFDQEPDDELRKMYKQKGYSGLMFNWSAIGRKDHEWRDGDIILDADFLEVVAMPLAIGACAKECAMNVEGKGKTKAFVTEAAASGLSKTFEAVGDIPGMADAVNLYNAITSQFNTDNAAKGSRVFNAGVQYLANTLPSFFIPNAYTQLGAGLDNTVRDTYTTDNIWQQAGNIVLNKTAFLRKKIPASVDMWGEERHYGEDKFWGVVNKTLLPGDRIRYRQNKYEAEIIRLTKEGYKGATPKLSVSGSFEVDGETYEMDADEKRAYRQNRNTEQAEVYKEFMDSPEYNMLTDDQKVAVLKDLKMDCERDAKQAMLNDRGLDVEVTRAKWETELPTTKQQITYLSMKQIAGAAWDSDENRVSDFAAMDKFLKDNYSKMTQPMRDILDGSMSQLDKMYDASKVGIGSEMWQKAYDIYRRYNSEEGQNAVDGGFKDWEAAEMWTKIEKATGANSTQMNWFEENMTLMRHMRVNPEHYQDLTDKLGWSRESSTYLTKAMSELQPSNGNKTVSYKQRLRCIAETPDVTDDQMWEAFYEYCPSSYTKIIKGMTNLRNRGYTYEQALKTYKSGKNSMWWVYEGE